MHLANHGSRNVGNAALIYGLERVLREDLPADVVFLPEPWDLHSRGLRKFDEEFVARVNADCDVLLVGAAVAFDGSGAYSNTGFRFDLPQALWSKVEVPILLYGLSHRSWRRRPYQHRDALGRALRTVLAADNVLFAVRNDGTKEFLESIAGGRLEHVRVVPDPAVFVPTEAIEHPELARDRPNVLVATNAEDEIERFGHAARKRAPRVPSIGRPFPFTSSWSWREHREAFLRELAPALGRLVRERNANLIFCANDPYDLEMALDLFELLEPDIRYDVSFASAAVTVPAGPSFYDLYAQADAVLGMRIHSMTPPIGMGTPVLPIVSQDRMRSFMADAGIADLCIEMLDAKAGDFFAAAAALLDDAPAARARLQAAREGLRKRSADFHAEVATFIGL
jgi:hypothetical protein